MSLPAPRRSDVYINEINLSYAILGASTAVGAIVVVSKKGSGEVKHFTNFERFRAHYGDPDPTVSFTGYCAEDYFKEGNSLYAVRAIGTGATVSAVALIRQSGGNLILRPVSNGVEDPLQPEWNDLANLGEQVVGIFYPEAGPGSYGQNLAIELVTSDAQTPRNVQVESTTESGTLTAGNYAYRVAALGARGETLASDLVEVVIAGGVTNGANTLTWMHDPLAVSYFVYGRTSAGMGLLQTIPAGTNTFTDTGALIPEVEQQPKTNASDATVPSPLFTVNVYDHEINRSNPQEEWRVSFQEGSDGTGSTTEIEQRINAFSLLVRYTSNLASVSGSVVPNDIEPTNMGGGDSGAAVTAYTVAAAWRKFTNRHVIPVNTLINGGISDPIAQRAMDSLSQKRGDCASVLDVPSNQQRYEQAINYRKVVLNLNSTYSALFCPDVLEADTRLERNVLVPFSGWAAALCARTDRVANPSFSIAGLNRGLLDILGTRHVYDDDESNELYAAQVNYTRTFIGAGTALWEQQTLTNRTSALSWFSVRRIANVIKVALYNYGIYQLQEPNDEFTVRSVLKAFDAYLTRMVDARAIHEFTLVSDSRNNNEDMRIAGIRRILVRIVPVIPIHELQLDIAISRRGTSVEEILAQIGNI